MPRTFAGFVLLLAALALLSPGNALGGPPERAPGRMVFDEVADGLRKYRKEKDGRKRVEWLTRLAATHDIRVQLALADTLLDHDRDVCWAAMCLLGAHYLGATDPRTGRTEDEQELLSVKLGVAVRRWCVETEDDLRRRAAQLPQ